MSQLPSSQQWFDNNGNPLASGTITTYVSGTTTLKASYSDVAMTVLNANPIVLDSAGKANIYGAGSYKFIIKNSLGTTLQTTEIPDITSSSTVSFLQAGTGAVTRTMQSKERDIVSVKDFGAKGDGVTDDTAAIQAAVNYAKSGFTLDFGNGTYFCGNITSANGTKISIDSPVGLHFTGNNALITCTTSGTPGKCSVFSIKNPIDFASSGINFTQPGFSIASTGGTVATINGITGFLFYATSPYSETNQCGPVYVSGSAYDCIGFVAVDGTNQFGQSGSVAKGIRNIVVTGNCDRVYYGMTNIHGATDSITRLVCVDVRRGLLSYGLKRAVLDYTLRCTANFLGSNGFIELAAQGTSYGDPESIRINLCVTGVEAHAAYITFYNQTSTTIGSISDVISRIQFDGLTVVGKNSGIGPTSLYSFLHENDAGAVVNPTTRNYYNFDLEAVGVGTFSGNGIWLQSPPAVKTNIVVGPGISSTLSDFGLWNVFNVVGGGKSLAFTPTLMGSTGVNGAEAYSVRKGWLSIVNGVATYSVNITWTGHTGTGGGTITGIPISALATSSLGIPVGSIFADGFGAANSILGVILTSGVNLSLYRMDITTRVLNTASPTAAGSIYVFGSFPLY